jgi:hypothetical protein
MTLVSIRALRALLNPLNPLALRALLNPLKPIA